MPQFARYLGIDYSGAQTPNCSLKGLRVYMATHSESPTEVPPPPSPRKHWTRRSLAEWIAETLYDGPPTLVGIDHAFSFPLRYFEVHRIPPEWPTFLEDFHQHWPTDEKNMYVDFIREGTYGNGAARTGLSRWRRMTEERCRAKSVFHFDVPGSVAKSTHAGLPWLLYLRRQLGPRLHFWPFDGWTPPADRSVIAEIYPSLWSKTFPIEDRTADQHDAYSAAQWMQETDAAGKLSAYFWPHLAPARAKPGQGGRLDSRNRLRFGSATACQAPVFSNGASHLKLGAARRAAPTFLFSIWERRNPRFSGKSSHFTNR